MKDYKNEETMLPDWMCMQEEYTPSEDREAFLTKSTRSILSVLAKLQFHEGKDGRFSATPSLKLFYTLLYIILTACSGNYLFTLIMCAAVTVRLAFFPAKSIRQILSGTAGAVLLSVLILFPSVFMGTPETLMNITSKVYVSVTLMGILSAGTSWNKLTGSIRAFRVPSIFIFTLDITLKYISVLGEMCADILTSVRLRSVGKNPQKALHNFSFRKELRNFWHIVAPMQKMDSVFWFSHTANRKQKVPTDRRGWNRSACSLLQM